MANAVSLEKMILDLEKQLVALMNQIKGEMTPEEWYACARDYATISGRLKKLVALRELLENGGP